MKGFRLFMLLLFMSLVSCKSNVKEEELDFLNGYWEITKVELPDGETKSFKVNETIDFFNLDKKKGTRNKVIPQLNGTIISNSVLENFSILEKEDTYYFEYKTNYASWEEELVSITKQELVVKNSNDLVYYYKKREDLKIK